MPSPADFVNPTTVLFGKLLLAVLLGVIIGTERAVLAHQAAGTRTFGLVTLGACLFVLSGSFVDSAYLGISSFDPLRMAAAVVMGIGFIGGGLIIFKENALRGITTAAGLWLAAGVGIAVGFGMYAVSIFATLLALIVLIGMWYVENRFKHWFSLHGSEQ